MAVYWFVRVGVCFFFMFCVQDRPTILHPPFDCCTLNMNTLLKTTYTHGSNNRIPNKLSTNKTFTIYIIWECVNSNSPAELNTFTDHVLACMILQYKRWNTESWTKKTARIIDKEWKNNIHISFHSNFYRFYFIVCWPLPRSLPLCVFFCYDPHVFLLCQNPS